MRRFLVPIVIAAVALIPAGATHAVATGAYGGGTVHVTVPDSDRFLPFARTIHVGDTVAWTNHDTDDHTVVSDDVFNTTGPRKINALLKGTESNGGEPGRYAIFFNEAGTFVYHCRFHSHVDSAHQPVAPGPDGGIQDEDGNFGTPMMGIITVLP